MLQVPGRKRTRRVKVERIDDVREARCLVDGFAERISHGEVEALARVPDIGLKRIVV